MRTKKVNTQEIEETQDLGIQIVVIDNGFVWVGDTLLKGPWVEMYNVSNVRQYGTDKGLPQLANEGPLAETKLDPLQGLLKFPLARLTFFMEVNKDKWESVIHKK